MAKNFVEAIFDAVDGFLPPKISIRINPKGRWNSNCQAGREILNGYVADVFVTFFPGLLKARAVPK